MRPQFDLRPARTIAALGALGYVAAGPLAAHGDVSATAAAQPTQGPAYVPYEAPATFAGQIPGAAADRPVTLLFAPNGTASWTPVASAVTSAGGAYRLSARLDRSGSVRVELGGTDPRATAATTTTAARPIAVGASIRAYARRRDLLAPGRVVIAGVTRPAIAGRVMTLQRPARHGWTTIAHTRTGSRGEFRIGLRAGRPGTLALRVRFGGDQLNGAAHQRLAAVNVYRRAGASWYGPGGALACGGSLSDSRLGVAHKTLPCGTLVTLRYGSRTVRVPVIDRGPYVAGRDYDLTPATKRALRFGDTGTIWATR